MKTRHFISPWMRGLVALILTVAIPVYGQQESIVLDPASGDYVITYRGLDLEGNPKWHQVVYVPATKINPRVKSEFRVSSRDVVAYSYKIKNHSQSKQAISSFDIRASHVDSTSEVTPKGWWGIISSDFDQAGQESGFIVGWSFETSDLYAGLAPGKNQHGFGLESPHLPGIGVARLRGATEIIGFPDEGPGDDNPIYPELKGLLRNNFATCFAAVPKIPNPQPFDAASVLTNLQRHVKEDIVGMKLIDPVFAAQLDRGLQAAIDAAKRGNTAGLRGQLKELRLILKGFGEPEEVDHSNAKDDIPEDQIKTKAWPHPISKLAARVIDFDLEYIEKRVK